MPAAPSAFDQNNKALNEAQAQFAVYCHTEQQQGGAWSAFNALLENQSPIYCAFKRLPLHRSPPEDIWAALHRACQVKRPCTLEIWLLELGE